MSDISDRIRSELADSEYRHAYAQEFLDMTIARQIRALRKDRGWSQAQLAAMLDTQQSRISEIESEEYGALSIATLKDLARVFDVYLNVRFTGFSELLSQVDRTGMGDLTVQPYSKDSAFRTMQEKIFVSETNEQPALGGKRWLVDAQRLSGAITAEPYTALTDSLAPKIAA